MGFLNHDFFVTQPWRVDLQLGCYTMLGGPAHSLVRLQLEHKRVRHMITNCEPSQHAVTEFTKNLEKGQTTEFAKDYIYRRYTSPGDFLGVFHPFLWPLKAPGCIMGRGSLSLCPLTPVPQTAESTVRMLHELVLLPDLCCGLYQVIYHQILLADFCILWGSTQSRAKILNSPDRNLYLIWWKPPLNLKYLEINSEKIHADTVLIHT